MSIDEVNVKLSFLWMIEGRGLVKEIFVRGIRGTIDRRTEWHDPNWFPVRRKAQRGDFEFTKLNVQDSVLTL
jgi:distribution and morphology protein 31